MSKHILSEERVEKVVFLHKADARSLTSSTPVAEVREPPDVAQAHCVAHAREDKLDLVAPVASPSVFILLHWLSWNCSILYQTERDTEVTLGDKKVSVFLR